VLSRDLPREAEDDHVRDQSELPVSRPGFEPSTSLKRYQYTNQLGLALLYYI
jgi:hypothetical protein